MKILVLLLLTSCGFEIVDTGRRGILTRFGKVDDVSLPEGLHFFNPLTEDIVEMDVQEQKLAGQAFCYSRDAQTLSVDYVLNYSPDPAKIPVLYRNLGTSWADKIIGPILNGRIKEVMGQHEATDLIVNRSAAVNDLTVKIREDLAKKMVFVNQFEITNMDFNDSFEHAVEAKVVAIQKAQEAKNKTVQIEEESRQVIIKAQSEAESMRIRSRALQENKSLVEWEAVQRWNGVLPQYMGAGPVPFLNIKGS